MAPEKSEADTPADTEDEFSERRRFGAVSLKTVAAVLVMMLPLAVAAGYLWGSHNKISSAWGSSESESNAAPAVGGMNVDVNQIQEARRNLGEANTEAGFAKIGAASAKDGSAELEKGAKTAKDGSKDLSDGMVSLQNGTAQLGGGAKSVADGVSTMVDGMTGLVAAQTAIIAAIDQADTELQKSSDPNAPQIRSDLQKVKQQVTVDGLNAESVDKATKLKDGANQISYQLNEPGAEYHDGVYSAAKGAKDLSGGLKTLHEGSVSLRDGLVTVDRQVGTTNQKVGDSKRAMPVPSANQLEAAGEESDTGKVAALAPTIAVLVAALAMLGAALVWGTDWLRSLLRRSGQSVVSRALLIAGVTAGVAAVAAVALFAVAEGFTWQRGLAGVGVLFLAALTAGLMTAAALRIFSEQMGRYVVVIFSILQVGIVGVVWRTSMATDIPEVAQAAAALMPLHYPTMALTAIGNATAGPMVWIGVGVLAVLAVVSEAVIVLFGRPENDD